MAENLKSSGAPALSPVEFARWTWRQLTSMRTALILLFLLALAAIPGSVIPQEVADQTRLTRWQDQHPKLTDWFERFGLFHVYSAPWFAAIYLLLVVSLVGCIVPRTLVYWRGVRAEPPKAPRNLLRLPHSESWDSDDPNDTDVLARAEAELKRRRYRVRIYDDAVCAERGYLREAGNLLFHLAILVVLAGVAAGSLFGFKGGVIVVTGDGFSNQVSQYDQYTPGLAFQPSDLEPFSLTVDAFHVKFIRTGRSAGAAHKFNADLSIDYDGKTTQKRVSVNHPVTVGNTQVYLIGHGYAPHITVRDGEGNVAYSGPTVFVPENQNFTSFGVVKAVDALPTQLAFQGELYPTYAFTMATGPFSAFPDAKNPAVSMLAYQGDLGMDTGRPQSVYALDMKNLTPIKKPDGKPLRIDLAMGQTKQLPDKLGSISFDGLSRYVQLQVSSRPGAPIALAGTILALIGLLGSLYVRPRRVWLRVVDHRVQIAALDRSSGGDPSGELAEIVAMLGGTGEKEQA